MDSGGWAADRRSLDDSIIVALGGNLAASEMALRETLETAFDAMTASGLRVERRSRFWRSAAWPDPSAPAFLNAVALVETALRPAEVLTVLHRIEALSGRVRDRANAPRTLDLDLIAYGRLVCSGPLVLPHPRAAARLFVMGPLAELAPGWVHPVAGTKAAELAAGASVGRDATPLPGPP